MNFLTFSRKKTYLKILLTLTVSVTTTILVLATILYFNFERISLSIINNFIKDSLSQISYSAKFMKESADTLALQISLDSDTSQLLFYDSLDSNEITTGLNRINMYTKTAPFINSIYVYDSKEKRFFTNIDGHIVISESEFFDKDIIDILHNLQLYDRQTPLFRKMPDPNIDFEQNDIKNVFTFIFYEYSNQKNNIRKAIVLNLSEDWMRRTINALDMNPQSNTFIINNEGTLLISNKNKEVLANLSEEKYIQKIIESDLPSGYFMDHVNGTHSLITYIASDFFDWKFVQITPYNHIIIRLNDMKLKALIISIIILIIGILSSLFISDKLYQPIDKMIEKLRTLETEKRKTSYQLKQQFLQQLVLGKFLPDPILLNNKFKELGMALKPENNVFIILVRIDNFMDFCDQYNASDRDLLKYAMMNIASEICSPIYTNECVNIREDHIVVICTMDDYEATTFYETTETLSSHIQTSIKKYLLLSVTITISSSIEGFDDITLLYNQTLETSKHRLFTGHGSIIFNNRIKNNPLEEYVYPIHTEKILIEALMSNNFEQIYDVYLDIINHTRDCPYTIFESTITHLAYEINQAVACIKKNSRSDIPYNLNTFIVQINKMEIIEDVNHYVLETFNAIHNTLKNNQNNRYDHLLEKISLFILDHHSDKSLCLNAIADEVNMSPVYLGRLYKKLSSKSIAEHILEIRLEKAKDLLIHSKLSVNDIIDKIGFVNAGSFYTAFKKSNGITPGQYRKNLKMN